MRDLIEAELVRSQEIIKDGQELVPRFVMRIAEGDVALFVQLSKDAHERSRRMKLVSDFMQVRQIRSFVLATELVKPDASVAMGVSADGNVAGAQIITRSPLSIGETQWEDSPKIGEDILALLPDKVTVVTSEQVVAVEEQITRSKGLHLEWRR